MFENLKIRCSEIADIMTGTTTRGLTEKQAETLLELQSKEKRTEKQTELMNELIEKRDAPPALSKTTINYLKEVALRIETGREKEIETDAMYRGTKYEGNSIEILNQITGKSYKKFGKRLENDYITGEPDIVGSVQVEDEYQRGHYHEELYIRDVKSSQDIFSHPWYETENQNTGYYYQLQGYMWLTGAKVAYLDYVLLDAPEWWLLKELRNKHFDLHDKLSGQKDSEKLIQEQYDEYELKLRFDYTYQDLPLERRLKTFTIYRSDSTIEKIKEQINLIRQFKF